MAPKSKGGGRGGGPKPGTKQAKAAAEKSAQSASTQQPEGEAKKPTVKQVIGGASWTGKLPVNLLSEHCQKQKWGKPEYTMHKTPAGFVSNVILSKIDPKTQETVTLPPMQLPPAHKPLAPRPTALEARHFAATYALYRVCNMRNMQFMLPPDYRTLWKEDFPKIKSEAVAENKAWMYEADPFLAKVQQDAAAVEMEKKRVERQKAQAKLKEEGGLGSGTFEDKKSSRHWSQAPKVELGTKIRREIEELLRHKAVWNPYGVRIPEPQRKAIVDELSRAGFRRSHIEEAITECKDREEVLEWLLLYVPEDDLPRWSLPEGYTAGITLASGDLVRESKIKRLTAAGYPTDICAITLDKECGNEEKTAETLQDTLTQHLIRYAPTETDEHEDAWAEEVVTLEAIFGDRYKKVSRITCEIKGDVSNLGKPVTFRFQRPSSLYPSHPPVISVLSDGLPAYIRLSAIRKAVQYALEDLTGTPMVFSLVDWLETNLPEIIENPGQLRDISAASSSKDLEKTATQLPIRSGRRHAEHSKPKFGSQSGLVLRQDWEAKQKTKAQMDMNRQRQSLPAWAMQEAIIQCVNTYQVTIISGETGSGKSTQSVQFVLDDLLKRDLGNVANIVCTQPRRISALGLADRVSDERCSAVGDEVGYIIRGDSKVKSGRTRITFMTTGVLLRRLQTATESVNDIAASLSDISHVVVDEVHERGLDTDFLLALLRDILNRRQDLKVILMSATLDANIFMQYFGGPSRVGRVNIPGRTYPVDDYYVDDILRQTGFSASPSMVSDIDEADLAKDQAIGKSLRSLGYGINYELIAATVRYIDSQLGNEDASGILIFLPGTAEIDRCLNAIRTIPNLHALPLHASLLPAEQKRVFNAPPRGRRKVIAATNVAETSITIDDIVAVIDTGRVKETSFDPKDNVVKLQEVWASQAACKQRRGRAGRVKAGICYKLYTRNVESNMAPRPDPEIRRVPLEQLCLSVVAMNGIQDAADFLAKTITPPETLAVEGALTLLHSIGALDNQKLTALGRHMSMIPADLRCAKLMVYGSIFSCVDACVTISAILIARSPFVSPREKREEAAAARASFSRGGSGDLLTDFAAYQQWSERSKSMGHWQSNSWCSENFLSHQTLREISSNRAQLLTSLKDAGILPIDYKDSSSTSVSSLWDRNTNNTPLLQALIAGAFNPQVAQISFPNKKFAASMTGTIELDPDARTIKYFNRENGRVFIHPSSNLFSVQNYSNAAYLSYFSKMETSKVFVRELTPFNAYSLLLFAGPINLDTMGRGLIVDGWLHVRGWARIGVLVSRLRMMLDDVLAARIDNPASSLATTEGAQEEIDGSYEAKVIELVTKLAELNGLDQ